VYGSITTLGQDIFAVCRLFSPIIKSISVAIVICFFSTDGDNLNRHFRNKKRGYLKDKIYELATNSKNKNFRDLYDFKRGYQPRSIFLIRIVGSGSTRQVGHWMAYCTCPGWLWWRRIWWNEDWQGKPKYSEKTCPSATLATTNPTWSDPGLNPGRRSGKPVTNRLS
jgi:hypothetical protein